MSHSPKTWIDNTHLYSEEFEDIYFNTENGIAESEYVFIDANNIANRFANNSLERFTLLELGFGTGLNFLNTLKHWQSSTKADSTWLDYIAIDKYPLTAQEINQALLVFPSLKSELALLLASYGGAAPQYKPKLISELWVTENVRLTYIPFDVADAIKHIIKHWSVLDAIYLDGFAPSKNPDMWSSDHYQQLSKICSSNTTFSSFTAAGTVRKGLQDAGFVVQKQKGYGQKREMILGHYGKQSVINSTGTPPWFKPASFEQSQMVTPNGTDSKTLIVGGGIAGLSTAFHLAKTGKEIVLIDSQKIASGASGNRAGLAYPQFDINLSPMSHWSINAYEEACNFYREIDPNFTVHKVVNIELQESAKFSAKRLDELSQLEELTEIITFKSGKYWLSGIQVEPNKLCHKIKEHFIRSELPVKVIENCQIKNMTFDDGQYKVCLSNGKQGQFDYVIYCSGKDARQLDECLKLGTDEKWGQVNVFDTPVNHPISAKHYFLPVGANTLVGASYHKSMPDKLTRQQVNDVLSNSLLEQTHLKQLNDISSRVSCRMTTMDRFPMIGGFPEFDQFQQAYCYLYKGLRYSDYPCCPYKSNALINVGYGSRGFSHAPWGAQFITKLITLPGYSSAFSQLVHPSRFIISSLKRSQSTPRQ